MRAASFARARLRRARLKSLCASEVGNPVSRRRGMGRAYSRFGGPRTARGVTSIAERNGRARRRTSDNRGRPAGGGSSPAGGRARDRRRAGSGLPGGARHSRSRRGARDRSRRRARRRGGGGPVGRGGRAQGACRPERPDRLGPRGAQRSHGRGAHLERHRRPGAPGRRAVACLLQLPGPQRDAQGGRLRGGRAREGPDTGRPQGRGMGDDVVVAIVLIVLAVVLFTGLVLAGASIRVLREYERAIVFRLGRVINQKGPGLVLLIPAIDRMVRVSLRTVTLRIPPQEVITRDNVPVRVAAVAYFRIIDPARSVVEVEDFESATLQIAQTTLRSVLGKAELDALLAERERLNESLQQIIDEQTEPWGIKVTTVEIKDVEIPERMQQAIARQAEAERNRRAKVINSEGEFQAAARLAEAAQGVPADPGPPPP